MSIVAFVINTMLCVYACVGKQCVCVKRAQNPRRPQADMWLTCPADPLGLCCSAPGEKRVAGSSTASITVWLVCIKRWIPEWHLQTVSHQRSIKLYCSLTLTPHTHVRAGHTHSWISRAQQNCVLCVKKTGQNESFVCRYCSEIGANVWSVALHWVNSFYVVKW